MRRTPLFLSLITGLAFSTLLPPFCEGQSILKGHENSEDFRIEVMGSAWMLQSGGQIQANGTPVDFVNDLNVYQNNATFFGQLVFKPRRRHRIVAEGTPLGINGLNSIDRQIAYRGRTFNVNQTVTSSASLNTLFAGYQYDVLTSPKGHLGFSAGAIYLDATGTLAARVNSNLTNMSSNTSATKNQKIVLPLAGFDFRIFPIPGHKIIEVEGGIRGMAFGDYGYYVQGIGQGGIALGAFTILAGYRGVNTSVYVNAGGGPSGITARLKGPIVSGMFRW